MKKILIYAASAIMISSMLASCGASKKVAATEGEQEVALVFDEP